MNTSILWFGLVVLTFSWTNPCVAQSLSRAEKPEIRVGDASIFEDRNIRIGEKREIRFRAAVVDSDKIVTETAGATSGTRTFTRDWNLIEIKSGDTVTQSAKPFWPYLRFPLEIGQTWESPIDVEVTTLPLKRHAKWRWKARVVTTEAVTVPAGTFQAFRIEYEGTYVTTREDGKSWAGTHKETAWYAPEVMRIVRREFEQSASANNFFDHHVIELLSFEPAR